MHGRSAICLAEAGSHSEPNESTPHSRRVPGGHWRAPGVRRVGHPLRSRARPYPSWPGSSPRTRVEPGQHRADIRLDKSIEFPRGIECAAKEIRHPSNDCAVAVAVAKGDVEGHRARVPLIATSTGRSSHGHCINRGTLSGLPAGRGCLGLARKKATFAAHYVSTTTAGLIC